MHNSLKQISLIIILFSIALIVNANNNVSKKYTAVKGILDLRSHNFETDGVVTLNGEWEFYWNKIYTPQDLKESFYFPDLYLNVPGSWNSAKLNDKKLPLEGYGTYKLKVYLGSHSYKLRFYTLHKTPASRYYVNGKFVGGSGIISDQDSMSNNKLKISPEFSNQFFDFKTKSDSIEIVVQVANYQVEKSGLIYSISMGTPEDIQNSINKKLTIYVFLIGVFFVMSLYHLSLWHFRRKDKALLYFALTCLTLSIYFFHTSNLINLVFKNVNFELSFKILRISLFATVPAFSSFIHAFFPKEYNKWVARPLVIIGLVCIFIVLFFPSYIHREIVQFYRVFMLLGVLTSVVTIFIAFLHKRSYAGLFLLGFGIFAATAINDLLRYLEVLHSVDLLQFGLFAFILTQSIMLSSRISHTFSEAEKVSEELVHVNENLEEIVIIRTKELEHQKTEIEELALKISAQNEELERSNKQINESLMYASRIQGALLPLPQKTSTKLPPYFIFHRPKHIVSGDFYWIKTVNKHLVYVIADCTGHGVPGAFMSILGISFLNEIVANETNISKPNLILDKLRIKVTNALNQTGSEIELRDGMDISIYVIDTETNKLFFSGAKMPLYIIRSEENQIKTFKLEPNIFSIGILNENKYFDIQEFQLMEGDSLYTFSDGFIDQFGGEKGKKFNILNFEKLLVKLQAFTIETQKHELEKEFDKWKGNGWFQVDDVIVMGLKITDISTN